MSNSEIYTELRTTSFIESTGVACSDSVSHNRVQVLSIPVLLTSSQDWTFTLYVWLVIGVGSLELLRIQSSGCCRFNPDSRPKRCGNNNKDEGNSPKTLNDKLNLKITHLEKLLSNNYHLHLSRFLFVWLGVWGGGTL